MGAIRLALSGAVLAMAAIAQPAVAEAANPVSGPSSQANVWISVSVAPRVQFFGTHPSQKGGLLCLTGTKLGATAILIRRGAGAAPKEVVIPIAGGPNCDRLDFGKVHQLAIGADEQELLLVAPR